MSCCLIVIVPPLTEPVVVSNVIVAVSPTLLPSPLAKKDKI